MSNNLGSYIMISAFLVISITFMTLAGTNIYESNTRLDNESKTLLLELQYSDFNDLDFADNSTFNSTSTAAGENDFALEYRESRANAETKRSTAEMVTNFPNLMWRSLGVDNNSTIIALNSTIITLMLIFIGFAVYKMFRTGETD